MTLAAPMYEILVVDDSPVYRKLIEQILAGQGYLLSFACNGGEALRILSRKNAQHRHHQIGSCLISLA